MSLSTVRTGGSRLAVPYPSSAAGRLLSLTAALAAAAVVLLAPMRFAHLGHGPLTLLMWGMAAGFVHGVGFVPAHPLWRLAFHPLPAWGLLAFGLLAALAPR